MALSGPFRLVRAVLASHAQISLNRLQKQLGSRGALLLVLALVFFTATLVAPFMLGAFSLGYFCVNAIEQGQSPERMLGVLGAALTVVSVGGGVLGGVSTGARQLSWEQYRAYPVGLVTLFFAELLAGLADLLTGLGVAVIVLACLGAALAGPSMALGLGALGLMLILQLLALQLLVGGLAEKLIKRFRLALALTAFAAWSMTNLMGDPGTQHQLRDGLGAVGGLVKAVFAVLPAVKALHAAQSWAWVGLVPQLGVTLLLTVLAYLVVSRESDGTARAQTGGAEALWSFRHPRAGIARLQLKTIMGSAMGKFGFLMPIITIVIMRGSLAKVAGTSAWAVPAAFAYVALAGNNLGFNQFGLDGHGVKGLFLLPISERDLLAGKQLGLLLWQGAQALFLAALLSVVFSPPPVVLLAGLTMSVGLFLVQNVVGQRTSVAMPRRFGQKGVRQAQLPPLTALLSLVTTLGAGLGFVGAFVAVRHFAEPWLLPVMIALTAGAAGLAMLLLDSNARYLAREKERVIAAVG